MEDAQGAATTAPPAEPSPRTDRLELLQQLSGGSVGVVHKARNPKLNRIVALRQLQVPEWLDDADDLVKRILADARAASALDHPNIARLYTGGFKGFTVFLTSEFVDGANIREFASNRNLGVADIIALGKQFCSALDYAHQKKVFHNALTPANLKVLPDGNLKIVDFGLFRDRHLYTPTPAKRLESEHYLSPEQLKQKPVSQATNLFSAASILYELLTTRSPFAGKHLGEVDRNISEIDPAPASLAHARVSEAISKVLMKALAKHPLARFQSCAEFAAALEEALKAAPPKANGSGMASASPPARPAVPTTPPKSTNNGSNVPVKSVAAAYDNGQPSTDVPQISSNGSTQPIPSPKPAAPAKTANTTPRTELAPAAPSKMPVKLLTQWKLVGGVVAALFVVSALAISFNHRSKVSIVAPETAAPETAAQTPDPPPVQAPQIQETPPVQKPADPPATIDVRAARPRVGKQKVTKVGPSPASAAVSDGQLAVSSEPEGATIAIQGRTTDSWKTPQIVGSLAPAAYRVTVSKPGYATETRTVQVVSGNRVSLDLKLTALKASLTVGGTPRGARIVIDGKPTGKFTPAVFTLDPAVHTISLQKEGFFDGTSEIKLTAGQALSYSPSLTPAGRTDNIKVVGGGFKKLFGGGSSSGMARMEIKSDPKGAQISVNGNVLPKVTPAEIQLEPGNYEITLQKDGYKSVHKTVTAQANDKLRVDELLPQ